MDARRVQTVDSDRNDVGERIVRLRVKVLRVRAEDVRLESRLTTDLRADSLDLAELAVELGDGFHVKVPESDVQAIRTVEEAIEYFRTCQRSGSS